MYLIDGNRGVITVNPASPLSPLPVEPLRIDQARSMTRHSNPLALNQLPTPKTLGFGDGRR